MHIAILRTKKQSIQKTLAQIFFTVVGMLVYVHIEGYASMGCSERCGGSPYMHFCTQCSYFFIFRQHVMIENARQIDMNRMRERLLHFLGKRCFLLNLLFM